MKKQTITSYYFPIYKGKLFFYYLIVCITLIIAFFIPIQISGFIDKSIEARTIWNVHLMSLVLVCVAEMVFSSLKDEINIRLSNKISFHLEYIIADKIKHSNYEQVKKYDDAYLAQRMNNDSVIIGDYACEKLPYFVSDVLFIVSILCYLMVIDWVLGCIFIIGTIIYIISYMISNKYLFRFAEKMFEAQARFFSMLSDQFNSVLLIKINSWYEEKNKEFKNVVEDFYTHSLHYLRLDFLIKNGGMFFCRILMLLAMCEIGIKILHGEASIGMMTSLILFTELIVSKLNSANTFGDSYQKYKLASKRLVELNSYEQEMNGEMKLSHIDSIQLCNIAYMAGSRKITYPNITLNKGTISILKGENGAGKSTLIHLLLGILTACEGSISYNQQDIRTINMNDLRRHIIAVKNQTPYIIDGTLERNLLFGNERETTKNVKEFVKTFLGFSKSRGGLQMEISHKNTSLSGGEQQRIAISRTLYKDADFIILDEPTNGLDEASKYELISILREMKDKIVLVVTHDACFDTVAGCVIELK